MFHLALLYGVTASDADPFAYLVVGKHGAQLCTPVHYGLAQVGKAIVHERIAFLLGGIGEPLFARKAAGRMGIGMNPFGSVLFEVGNE